MYSDASRSASAKRARPWASPPGRPALVARTSDVPAGPSAIAPSTAPAPFMGLLEAVSTVELLRWLPASVSSGQEPVAESTANRLTSSFSAEPQPQARTSRRRTAHTAMDAFFSPHLATAIGHRSPDAMLTQTQRAVNAAMATLAPADACLFQLLLQQTLGPSLSSPTEIQPDAPEKADENAVHALTARRPAESASEGPMAPTTATPILAEDASTGPTPALKGILKPARGPAPPPAPRPSANTAVALTTGSPSTAAPEARPTDADLSLLAKLLYVILQTSTIGATTLTQPSLSASADGQDAECKGATALGEAFWTPTTTAQRAVHHAAHAKETSSVVPAPCDPSSPAWWTASSFLSPSSSLCALSTSPGSSTRLRLLASSPESRLWLSPSTIALIESSPEVAAQLRWSTAADPVLTATLDKKDRPQRGDWTRAWPSPDLGAALALTWGTSPESVGGAPRDWREGGEEEAVRRLFTTKSYASAGNRSPLTNRARPASGSEGGFARDGSQSRATADATTALTAPPPLLSEETVTVTAAGEAPLGGLLSMPPYTEGECAMLYVALHYCSVGVADPYLLTWLVRGDHGGHEREEREEDGEVTEDEATTERRGSVGPPATAPSRRGPQAGLKRGYDPEAMSSLASITAPMMALHPQFSTTDDEEEDAFGGVGMSEKDAQRKRARPEGVASPQPSSFVSHHHGQPCAPRRPPVRLCQRAVAGLLLPCCESGTLFLRLEQLCEVAQQPSKHASLGSYGRCAVDGLRTVLRLVQREASTLMMDMTPVATSVRAHTESPLHGLSFDRVLAAFHRLEDAIAAPLRVLAAVFGVHTAVGWDLTEALAHVSSAQLLSTLYTRTAVSADALFRPWRRVALENHACSSDDEDGPSREWRDALEDEEEEEERTSPHRGSPPRLRPRLTDAVGYLFCCTLSPLNRFLHRWLTSGERHDPLDEFFIVPSYGTTASGYDVDPSPHRLPSFISEETAYLWLHAGLSMRVLRLAATHVVSSAGFVFRRLVREEDVVDGVHGIEEAAAAREDAGLLHDAVGQFLTAVTGHGVSAASQHAHVTRKPLALPGLNPLAGHAAVAHWRLFFSDCDDVLVTAIEQGLEAGGGPGDEADEDDNASANDRAARAETSASRASGASCEPSRCPTAVSTSGPVEASAGAVPVVGRLTHALLRQNQKQQQQQQTQQHQEQEVSHGGPTAEADQPITNSPPRVIVKKRPQRGQPVQAVHSPVASHITIPLYSEASFGVGERSAPRGSVAAMSSRPTSQASWSDGAGRRRVGRARSFMSYDSGVSTRSSALSAGATSALYGAIKAEHRLSAQGGPHGDDLDDVGTAHGGGTGHGAMHRQLQADYEARLRAHQRLTRLTDWKARRQSLWVARGKAVRDAVSLVQAFYSVPTKEEGEEALSPPPPPPPVPISVPSTTSVGVTGMVRPCASLPSPRRVVVLYPRLTRLSAASATVAFREGPTEAEAPPKDERPRTQHAPPDPADTEVSAPIMPKETVEEEEDRGTTTAVVSPSSTPIEITISPVVVALPMAPETHTDLADEEAHDNREEGEKEVSPHAGTGQVMTTSALHTPPRAASVDSWLSPQVLKGQGVTPVTSPTHTHTPGRPAVHAAAVLAALWSEEDGEASEAATLSTRSSRSAGTRPTGEWRDALHDHAAETKSERWDSLGLPQPASFFVVADINDDEYIEQRTLDGVQQQQRRREKLARMTRARTEMDAWRTEAIVAQMQAPAIVDLPAYHEACQGAVARLFEAQRAALPSSAGVDEQGHHDDDADDDSNSYNNNTHPSVVQQHPRAEAGAMSAFLESLSVDAQFRQTWWCDAPDNAANPDRQVWRRAPPRGAEDGGGGADADTLNPLLHNTSQQLLDETTSTDPIGLAHAATNNSRPFKGRADEENEEHRHDVRSRPSARTTPVSVSLPLRLSSAQRQLLAACPAYYRHIAQLATRYSTHKALQLALLPPHGLQFQWLCSCLDVCLLQHAPTAFAVTDWWSRQVRARLDDDSATHSEEKAASSANLLLGLNAVFGEAWVRLRTVTGAAATTAPTLLPTDPTRVVWRLTSLPTTATATTSQAPGHSFLRADTASAALDALLLFLADLRLCRDGARDGEDTTEASLLAPSATLVADYGDVFATLLFWKLVDHLLAQLYQDGLACQEKAVFFLCNTSRALLHTLQSHFWERLQVLAAHYRRRSVDSFGAEALYGYASLEAFRQQHHGFVAECRFTAMLSSSFRLCQARLLALLQEVVAAQTDVHRATQRVVQAGTEPGKKEQRRRVRDVVSQHLRRLAEAATALAEEVRVVQDHCAGRAMPAQPSSTHPRHVAETEAERAEDEDEDELIWGDGWYNATEMATLQGNTERDRQQAWRSRTQYLTRVLDSLVSVVDGFIDRW